METMRSYVISNGVIKYKKKPSKSILKVVYRLKERYLLLQIFWTEQNLDKHYP